MSMNLYFTDVFGVSEKALEKHGAFNISLVADLPLFIDPFLLFASKKKHYRRLHDEIIKYLAFLRDMSVGGANTESSLKSWYRFGEVKQNWLGSTFDGNSGRGLGNDFARALNNNLEILFTDFGKERITRSSHLEKLCLIGAGVGRDMISDFTTNLIKSYLLKYTQSFATKHIDPGLHLSPSRRFRAMEFASLRSTTIAPWSITSLGHSRASTVARTRKQPRLSGNLR